MTSAALSDSDRLRAHVGELLRLAAPVIVSRAGLMVMMAVDTAIVGRYAAQELAYYGLAHLPANIMVGTGVGLLMGTVMITAHALGSGNEAECGRSWRRSIPYALLLGVLFALISLLGAPLFRLGGQSDDLARGGAAVLAVLGLGSPGMMLYITTGFFLEGIKRPMPGMIAMVIGNLVNGLLAWALVWGHLGFPAMGAVGSAWATTAVRWAMGLGLVAYVWWMHDHARWHVRVPVRDWWAGAGKQRHLGYAAGLSIGLESGAFAALGLFAGMISPLALAAYTVGLNLIALPFMAAVGLASATAVRVGVAFGQGDRRDMAMAGWTGLGVTSAILAVVGVLYYTLPEAIGAIYTTDDALLASVAPLIAFGAWILIADGGQTVMANALRGRHDAWVPTALHFVSYAVVMIPVSALLVFGLDRGAKGLFEGILIASVVSVTILSLRFAHLSRR
ncbi:MATE family efflux transporter [Azospirillum doebereinerae]|uniref:MATE family efflux transporter n=1 Tax=Azospirillum doebereinerae TaxID=92933 RepID=A0A3S0WUX0_9PROT|nr:MATE family efflux transporter [Azospirillum doebereinerae]RUQ61973.1 MATE family efflux transporter [Azospirillum doebereinerae]